MCFQMGSEKRSFDSAIAFTANVQKTQTHVRLRGSGQAEHAIRIFRYQKIQIQESGSEKIKISNMTMREHSRVATVLVDGH